jgi:hypothetical protein
VAPAEGDAARLVREAVRIAGLSQGHGHALSIGSGQNKTRT